MSTYPESEKTLAAKKEAEICGDFLLWLESRFIICESNRHYTQDHQLYSLAHIDVEQVLAEYFGINLEERDKERERMLQEMISR